MSPKAIKSILSACLSTGKPYKSTMTTGFCNTLFTDSPQITLKADQSMFSIEYAISNYIPSNRDDLEYFLEGFSKNWTGLYGQHTITYTNLNPGKYTLIVRAKTISSFPKVISTLKYYHRSTALSGLTYFIRFASVLSSISSSALTRIVSNFRSL